MALSTLSFPCCTKDNAATNTATTDSNNNAASQFSEDYWNWNKSTPTGPLFDIVCDGDTTIKF